MSVSELIQKIIEPVGFAGLAILIGSLIKIKPLEINLWQFIAKCIGSALNKDILSEVKKIQIEQKKIGDTLNNHIIEEEKNRALDSRKYILAFAREMLNGEEHTKEDYLEVLVSIDSYDSYCKSHPDFPNNRAICAKQLILDDYQERLRNSNFLNSNYDQKIQ